MAPSKSTENPPFTLPNIVPVTFSFISVAFSNISQDSSLLAFSLDRTASPFLFSTRSK